MDRRSRALIWVASVVALSVVLAAFMRGPDTVARRPRSPGYVSGAEPAGENPVQLGPNASLGGRLPFPDDNPWNLDISHIPVDANSDTYIASIGSDAQLHPDFGHVWRGVPWGIPYVVVPGDQPKVPVKFGYMDQSDHCLYPIPPDPPIEPASDKHMLIIDRDNWRLYELFTARFKDGMWLAGSGAVFDLNSNAMRPRGWTSADAAGLPVFPGLVRYDEVVEQGEIRHALRFTVQKTRRAYVYPARHFASRSKDASLPPMGMRVRLKASYDISDYPPSAQVILTALKKYGMLLSDNGSNWFLSGAPDPRWSKEEIMSLKRVKGRDLEVVLMPNITSG